MVRRVRQYRFAAMLAVAGISSIGIQPLLATGHDGLAFRGAAAPWSVQLLDGGGEVLHPSATPSVDSKLRKRPTRADFEKLRNDLTGQTFSSDLRLAAKARRALKLLEVAFAENNQERHARVSELGVQITEEPATDGRDGTIKSFVAGGKPRVRVFIPTRPAVGGVSTVSDAAFGGPFAEVDQTGRWKIGSSCYWDPNDTGPDQCSPNAGRWKIGDGCYFDSNDSGPDQCQPAEASDGGGDLGGYTCSDENGPGDCATQEQYDDLLSTIAEGQSELDDTESTYDSVYDDCVAAGNCDDHAEAIHHGPAVEDMNCVVEALGFVSGVAWGASALFSGWAVATGPITAITTAAAAGAALNIVAGVAAAAAAGIILYRCAKAMDPEPVPYNRPSLVY